MKYNDEIYTKLREAEIEAKTSNKRYSFDDVLIEMEDILTNGNIQSDSSLKRAAGNA